MFQVLLVKERKHCILWHDRRTHNNYQTFTHILAVKAVDHKVVPEEGLAFLNMIVVPDVAVVLEAVAVPDAVVVLDVVVVPKSVVDLEVVVVPEAVDVVEMAVGPEVVGVLGLEL